MSWKLGGAGAAALMAAVAAARAVQDADTGTATWDAARASGFAAYLWSWVALLTGCAVHLRFRAALGGLNATLELHRVASVLALAFVAVHMAALFLDPVVPFGPLDLAIPLAADYRPLATGLGTAGAWLLAAALATTAISHRLPAQVWKGVHMLSFPAMAFALVHGLAAGTSTGAPAALALYAFTAALAAAVGVVRFAGRGWASAREG